MDKKEELLTKYLKTRSQEDKETVILAYAPLAKLLAGQMYAKNAQYMLERGDYDGFAAIGLIDAIQKYDESVGVKFETYATYRIKGAIMDEVRKFDCIKRGIRDNQKLYNGYVKKATELYGPHYTRAQLLQGNDLTEEQLLKIEQDVIIEEAVSFEGLLGLEDTDGPCFEPKDESHLGDGEQEVLKEDLKSCLMQALEVLTEVERRVIELIYYEELSQAEVAEVLSISASRVSQVRTKALMKMRNAAALKSWDEN